MKIVVIHGDKSRESRARFAKIINGVKRKGWQVSYLNTNDNSLEESLSNQTIYEDESLYVIEEAKKIPKEKAKWLSENHDKFTSQLLLYSKTQLTPAFIKSLPKDALVEEFSHPKLLFKYLDGLYMGNAKQAVILLNELYKTEPTELIIAMMARTFRDLYWVLEGGNGMGYPDWRMRKLKSQAAKFTKYELEDILLSLAEIDVKSKTSDVDAKLLLEILLLDKLE